jgi:hypothetical protein
MPCAAVHSVLPSAICPEHGAAATTLSRMTRTRRAPWRLRGTAVSSVDPMSCLSLWSMSGNVPWWRAGFRRAVQLATRCGRLPAAVSSCPATLAGPRDTVNVAELVPRLTSISWVPVARLAAQMLNKPLSVADGSSQRRRPKRESPPSNFGVAWKTMCSFVAWPPALFGREARPAVQCNTSAAALGAVVRIAAAATRVRAVLLSTIREKKAQSLASGATVGVEGGPVEPASAVAEHTFRTRVLSAKGGKGRGSNVIATTSA